MALNLEMDRWQKIALAGGAISLAGFFLPWIVDRVINTFSYSGLYLLFAIWFPSLTFLSILMVIGSSLKNEQELVFYFSVIAFLPILYLFYSMGNSVNWGIGIWITMLGLLVSFYGGGIPAKKESKP